MKCGDVDNIIILAIFINIIGDSLALFAESLYQRRARKEDAGNEKEKKALITQLNDLEQRISKLEKTFL